MKIFSLLMIALLLVVVPMVSAQEQTTYEDDFVRFDYPTEWFIEVESDTDFAVVSFGSSSAAWETFMAEDGPVAVEDGIAGSIIYFSAEFAEIVGVTFGDDLQATTASLVEAFASDIEGFDDVNNIHMVSYANDYQLGYFELGYIDSESFLVVGELGDGVLVGVIAAPIGDYTSYKTAFVNLMQSINMK